MATRALQPASPGYWEDGYGWANHQAALIRAGRTAEIDWENVAEEIESVGRSESSKLESALRVLLIHLLKWEFQPERRGRSWALSIKGQRVAYDQALSENPSLKPRLGELLVRAYRRARIEAAREMDVAERSLPAASPFTLAEALTGDRSFDGEA